MKKSFKPNLLAVLVIICALALSIGLAGCKGMYEHVPVLDKGVSPTCTTPGLSDGVHCSVCGEILTPQVELEALGHTYVETVIPPTCTQKGYTMHTCHCGHTYVDNHTEALGHHYNPRVTAPTCTEQGYTTYICDCGDSYVADYTDVIEHSYQAIVTDPTCTDKGFTTHRCACGEYYIDSYVDELGHEFENDACIRCGETDNLFFIFNLLDDGTYEVRAELVYQMPSSILIPDVYEGRAVTAIAAEGFRGCYPLESVTLPASIKVIGDGAFYGCLKLENLSIASATTIGDEAFADCRGLKKVSLPNSVVSIGEGAFAYCSSLEDIKLSNSLFSIGDSAFAFCSNLPSISIPNSTRIIGATAFFGCDALVSVTISKNIQSIGEDAFTGCKIEEATMPINAIEHVPQNYLISVVLTNGEEIPSRSFVNCKRLVSVTIPKTVKSIKDNAFVSCYKLVEVINHASLDIRVSKTDAEKSEFGNVAYYAKEVHEGSTKISKRDNLVFYTFEGVNYIMGGYGNKEEIVTPSDASKYTIYDYAFESDLYASKITIGKSVTAIGYSAFGSCLLATELTIINSSIQIKNSSFQGCYFRKATIPTGAIQYINKSYLVRAIINGGTSIASKAFANCQRLISVTIPTSVTSIGTNAFQGCYKLVEIIDHASLSQSARDRFLREVKPYAIEIHSESDTKIINKDNWLFYEYNGVNYLFDYIGTDFNFVLPADYNGESYVVNKYAFYNYDNIESLVVKDNVTAIGNHAFYDCDGITSVDIGGKVKEIGANSFYNCDRIASVNIDGKAEIIGKNAFYNCDRIASVFVDGNNAVIGEYAFYDCDGIVTAEIGDSVVTVSEYAFSGCDSMQSVIVGEAVTQIRSYAFSNCKNLTDAVIGNDVEMLFSHSFYSCPKLENVTFGSSIRTIGENAFANCTSLNNVAIPDSTESIGYRAFYNCSELSNITIGDSVTYIDTDTLNGTNYYKTSSNWIDDVLYVGRYLIEAKPNISGSHSILDGTLCVAREAFYDCDGLTGIEIPNTVVSICHEAFADCDGLTSVAIPGSIKQLQYGLFRDCSSLLNVTFGEGLVEIGSAVFFDCGKLNTVVLPDSVTLVRDVAFKNCYDLTSLTLGDSAVSIAEDAFEYCHKLVEIINHSDLELTIGSGIATYAKEIHEGETKIDRVGDYLFYTYGGVNYLLAYAAFDREILLPANYNGKDYEVYSNAFITCTNMTEITIPRGVVAMGNNAFYDCSSLDNIYYVAEVKDWCDIRFDNVYSNPMYYGARLYFDGNLVTDLVITEGVTTIKDYVFRNCNSMVSLVIPSSTITIGAFAFEDCDNLKTVIIGDNATYFGQDIFTGCPIQTAILPENAMKIIPESKLNWVELTSGTNISADSFRDCVNLVSVKIPATVETISQDAFVDCLRLVEVINHSSFNMVEGASYLGFVAYRALEVHQDDTKIDRIGDYLFYTYEGVNYLVCYIGDSTSITLPASYHGESYEINRNAFANLTQLVSVNISGNVSHIGDEAFVGCEKLTNIRMSSTIKTIGERAFADCTRLTTLNIGNSVTDIASGAFAGCVQLGTVTIPDSIVSIATDAFTGCCIRTVTLPASVTASIPKEYLRTVTITSNIEIGNSAFEGCTTLTRVIIGDEVPAVCYRAFKDCTNLYDLTIGYAVTYIGEEAFYGCYSLRSLELSNSVSTVGASAFASCGLNILVIDEPVTIISQDAFKNCTSLTTLIIRNPEVVTMGPNVFFNCPIVDATIPTYATHRLPKHHLQNLTINFGSIIDEEAFKNCVTLRKVVLADSVTTIGESSFYGCTNLQSVKLGSAVETINANAFVNCYRLVEIINHSSLEITVGSEDHGSIAYHAIEVHSGSTKILYRMEYVFYNYNDVTYLINCFANNEKIDFTDYVYGGDLVINDYALYDCTKVKSIILPTSVISIGDHAFENSNALKEVFFEGNASEWAKVLIGSNNDALTNAAVYFFSSTRPQGGDGGYWHYVLGEIVEIWS